MDAELQLARRSGAGLLGWARSFDPGVTYTEAREVPCPKCEGSGEYRRLASVGCPDCNGKGYVPFHPWALIRARAFLGCPDSREIASETSWVGGLSTHLPCWVEALERRLVQLPPARWTEQIDLVLPSLGYTLTHVAGPIHHDTPASQYLAVVAAHAVEVECLRVWKCNGDRGCDSDCEAGCPWHSAKLAQAATLAWIEEPSPANLEAWSKSTRTGANPAWVPEPSGLYSSSTSIQAGAKIIGPERAREVMASSLLKVIRGR